MRDKRPVDELSIEELERILAIKKREARQSQLQRMKRSGRIVAPEQKQPAPVQAPVPLVAPPNTDVPAKSTPDDLPAELTIPETDAAPRFEDDPDAVVYDVEDSAAQDRAWKRFVNFTLLLVEVAAVVGLVFISFNLLNAITTLEAETDRAQEIANSTRQASIPTLQPTPSLRLDRVVLPGGHIRTETGEALPNYDEIPSDIPAHLVAEVRTQLFVRPRVRPPRTPETALVLNVPKLGIEQTIVQGTDWEALQAGIGQFLNGYDPGDPLGNVVLGAHNDIYGELFRDLDQLEVGDQFFIRTETSIYTYEVTGTDVVEPTAVEIVEGQGRPMATLFSCYPYGRNTHRIVVYADRVDV